MFKQHRTATGPLAAFNTADAVEHLNQLDVAQAARLLAQVAPARGVRLLEQPELIHAAEILQRLPPAQASALLDGMADDRAADLLLALDADARERLIAALPAASQQALRGLMHYPPGTAGSLMTTEFVSVAADQRVGDVLQHVREVERERETIYAIYVLDPQTRALQQVVTLRRLITADPDAPILDAAQTNPPVFVTPTTDQEEVARLIRRHDLLAIPVLDPQHQLVGIVTVDDVLDALIAESNEDVHRFGGVEALGRPYMQIGLLAMIRKRAGWLSVLFLGEMLTASAMQHYEDALSKALVLTLFIPLIMSSGGNSGGQATSLLIRSLALQEIRLRDWWRVALRELPTGMTLGAILGLLGIARITIWQLAGFYDYGPHWVLIALTIGAALLGIVTFGSLAGAMLPFVLQRLGFDPASASAPFVATLVDVSGLVIYFTIAAAILGGTLL
ncbi:magnesium transporter [Luteimonas sp. S4-F44]|uniref:magnesium transporter n=1 Tax=Luteimonas sp. S4-F44 TaxID=2925842 RepID=UPI001F53A7C0|nr:magnesium transporter [Luteimonas sp. S4-F44]UNK42546.1 magnesium transporter [Luteimonas sp. S4-F44]